MTLAAPRMTAPDPMLDLAASVFYYSRDGIMITALDGSILAVNPAFSAITGYAEHEVLGRNPRMLKSGRQDAAFYQGMWQAILEHGHWQGKAWNRRKDGSDFAERISISAVPDAAGRPHHYIAVFAAVTGAVEERRLLEQRCNFDPLTRLPNRALLDERLREALARADSNHTRVALAFIDLDGFKAVNDSAGHVAGDQLLVTMARRLQRVLRQNDTLARFGGDEFVAALPDIDDDAVLDSLLERMLAVARTPVTLDEHSVQLSASVGVAMYPRDGNSPDALIRCADAAMYAAKQSGRDCVRAARANVASE